MANQRRISADEAKQGGLTFGLDWTTVGLEPLRRGHEVECEHGARDREPSVTNDDLARTVRIAGAHLKEFQRLYRTFYRLLLHGAIEHRAVHGLPVAIRNDRLDVETDQLVARLDAALSIIASTTPRLYRHLCQDFTGFVLQSYPTRAAYQPWNRTCIVEVTFLGNASFSAAQLAAAIVYESVRARLHVAGARLSEPPSAKEARLCRRTEREFDRSVSGGEPVVARGWKALALGDKDAAPARDWEGAPERTRAGDVDALPIPAWARQVVARLRRVTWHYSFPLDRPTRTS